MVERDTVPAPLLRAVEAFEREVAAIGYVRAANVTVTGGTAQVVSWQDPEGTRCAFRDAEGWYGYERIA